MDKIEKAGIIGGAIVGGIIGGTFSIVGHVVKNDFLDELGDNIIDSTILTGQITGEITSGATNVVSGKLKHNSKNIIKGKKSLKKAGGKIANNIIVNYKSITDSTGEVIKGIHKKDHRKTLKGIKTLGKIAIISTITVGAVKLDFEKNKVDNTRDDVKLK